MSNKHIPGIYDYCDRWCERCTATQSCSLYGKEQEKIEEHRRKGEDPHDWNIVMQDIKEDFEETLKLIQKLAKEQGLDLNSMPEPDEDYVETDVKQHPLYKQSQNYMRLVHNFLKTLREILETEERDLTHRIEILPSAKAKAEVETFDEIVSAYEVISWFHTLVSAKIYRALSSKLEKKKSDPELQQIDEDDANRSAKVVYGGLVKSIAALQKIFEWNRNLQNDVITLLVEADRLRRKIDAEFPNHPHFKPPGLGSKNG